MAVKSKKLVAFSLIVSMLMVFSISYAQESSSNEEVKIDEALWNQAIMNVKAAERQEELAGWELLSQEEKYNRLYKDYMEELIGYYNEAVVLNKSLSDSYKESISGKCYTLMTKIDSTLTKVSSLTTESKYAYSKKYLKNSFSSLKKVVNYFDTYDLYIVTNDLESANKIAKDIEEELNVFMEVFGKAYNYYVITQSGGTVTDSLNQTEDTFYNKLKTNFDLIKSSYNMLEEAHGLIKEGKNGFESIKKAKESYSNVSFLNVKTLENSETIIKVNSVIELLKKAEKDLERYSLDVMTEGSGDDSKYISASKNLKVEIDAIEQDVEAIGLKVNTIADNVSEKVDEIENQELREAQENGYSSVEEYKTALKKQKELEYLDKVLKEYETLCEQKEQIEKEYQEMLMAIHEQWLKERIDFSKGQYGQNYDKNFYMEKVKNDLSGVYSLDNYLGSLIYKYQSDAYDKMWKIASASGAKLDLLQELYDEYPNDFSTIVLLYEVQSSFK
ncbi:MAG: hypothetical protein MJB12_11400 [Firmicutes bacterium]|nr:hypothetical protein [Bacillota bacterium]